MEALMNWKVAGMTGTALLTIALSGVGAVAGANKFSGNISLAVGQTFQDDDLGTGPVEFLDDSYASITGAAQVNVAFSNNINLQIDVLGVGSFTDTNTGFSLNRDAGFQVGSHLYWRDTNFAAGVYGGVGVASTDFLPTADYVFAGVEGQYYLNNITLGLAAGYLTSSSDAPVLGLFGITTDDLTLNDAWTVRGEARWYASKKVTLTADLGYISGEYADGTADLDVIHWGLKAEYKPEEKEPLTLWVAYEGRSADAEFNSASVFGAGDVDKDSHTVKVGVTFRFGTEGTVQEQDRSGPAFNQFDYGDIAISG
jgi:hypothetical protein